MLPGDQEESQLLEEGTRDECLRLQHRLGDLIREVSRILLASYFVEQAYKLVAGHFFLTHVEECQTLLPDRVQH